MELRKINEVLSKDDLQEIHKKAMNYAETIATNGALLELLYNKYYLQFLQEKTIARMCCN